MMTGMCVLRRATADFGNHFCVATLRLARASRIEIAFHYWRAASKEFV
jgi:hypothetical protein